MKKNEYDHIRASLIFPFNSLVNAFVSFLPPTSLSRTSSVSAIPFLGLSILVSRGLYMYQDKRKNTTDRTLPTNAEILKKFTLSFRT